MMDYFYDEILFGPSHAKILGIWWEKIRFSPIIDTICITDTADRIVKSVVLFS